MAYDTGIPETLQLLRTDLGLEETGIARYTISSWNTNYAVPFYCITDSGEDVDMMDVAGAVEETLHAILDNGGTPDDVRQVLGLVKESELDEDAVSEGAYTAIDLGYCIEGSILSMEAMEPDSIDISAILTSRQAGNVRAAFDGYGLEPEDRLPAAKLLAAHDYTEWQAFAVCKAFREGIDRDCIAAIADPSRNHSQMRELARIAAIEGKPYPLFKTCAAHPEYTAEKLRLVRHLMEDAKGHDIPVSPEWLDLTGGQISELSFAIKMDVPPDALERYATGEYPAVNMSYITMALTDGMEQAQVERLMNPKLDGNQSLRIYSALLGGSLTDAQLDFLCRPELPAPVMEAAYQGLAFGNLDLATVERYAVPAFSPEQMHAIFDAAASDEVTQAGLDVLADPQLTPQQMKTLQFDLEGGMQPLNAARAKGQMLSANHRPDKAAPDGSLRSAAKESRDASSQLQSAERSGERANEQEEIW